jgi:XTP/dITP diphosphohydrolase
VTLASRQAAVGPVSTRGRVLVATRNAGKLAELRTPFAALGFDVVDLTDVGIVWSAAEDAIEAYHTFEENAVAKARYYAALGGGLPTVADDSGLAVDALGGAPGVRSRRWAADDHPTSAVSDDPTAANNAKLLRVLPSDAARDARFICAVAYVDAASTIVERGETRGRIACAPRGAHGFGYDALFESTELAWRTFAEATSAEKLHVGHRGRALRRLFARLGAVYGDPSAGTDAG